MPFSQLAAVPEAPVQGKPALFREKVSEAKKLLVQVSSVAVTGKDGKLLNLSNLGAITDQAHYLAGHGRDLCLVFSGPESSCKKASEAVAFLLKYKEPHHSIPIKTFPSDNAIASAIAQETGAEAIIYLWQQQGVFSAKDGRVMPVYDNQKLNTQQPKEFVDSCEKAAATVCPVVVAGAKEIDIVTRIAAGAQVGTLFDKDADPAAVLSTAASTGGPQLAASAAPAASTTPASAPAAPAPASAPAASSARDMALRARSASRALQSLPTAERVAMLHRVADALASQEAAILAENAKDVAEAQGKVSDALLQRLVLKPAKIQQLAEGIRAIAAQEEPIRQVLKRTEVAEGLVLEKQTCPIGVLLVIFEARPDALPQISALALRSGNGLLLKGGKEATRSNACLHKIIVEAIGPLGRDLISLVQTREEITDLLALDDVIDLVIPRGGNALVSHVQRNTRIPVLGHADGVCHIYVDEQADLDLAVKIILDAKTDYPAACNAVEKVLVHKAWVASGGLDTIKAALQGAGVTVHAGSHLGPLGSGLPPAPAERHEYSSLDLTLDVVEGMQAAIDMIHAHGSSHTDCIVTKDTQTAETFLRSVDSACVFHNASTRFADGFRFGLGAEVGISTSRIHARGPVGVEGLLTSKWVLRGSGQVVAKDKGVVYTHKKLDTA